MEYPLYFIDNNYYLIINKAIYYNIAIQFETFNNLLISNEILSNSIYIEFNKENLNNFIKKFNTFINNDKIDIFNNWLEVFNYYKDI